jgi:hypothetical protein
MNIYFKCWIFYCDPRIRVIRPTLLPVLGTTTSAECQGTGVGRTIGGPIGKGQTGMGSSTTTTTNTTEKNTTGVVDGEPPKRLSRKWIEQCCSPVSLREEQWILLLNAQDFVVQKD